MAVCKIWSIKSNLSSAINYITNDEKTSKETYSNLHKELNYIVNDEKTEEKLYVSGINCNPENAKKEFMITKERFQQKEGILAFHAIQSFKETNLNPELVHNIGLQLANEMWGDRFQVVVATHLNTNHFHNHFIINSVSCFDGKRYYDTRTSYARLRKINDQLCMENNLDYMEEKKTKSGLNYKNFQLKNENVNIYDKQIKLDVDMAIGLATSYQEFLTILENMNYEVTERSEKLSIRSLKYNRAVRIERRFGNDYSIDNIVKRILGTYLPEQKVYYRNYFKRDELIDSLFKLNCKGLAIQYIKYLKLLNKYPTYIKNQKISYSMQRDVMRMDEISKQTIFLAKHNIQNEDDLINLYNNLREKFEESTSNKENIKEELKLILEIKKRIDSNERESLENEREVLIR